MRALLVALLGLMVAIACGGESDNDGGGGNAGAAGGGNAGAAGGGNAGAAGSADSSAGASGSSGQPSEGGAECETDADCYIVESCCECFPWPVAEGFPTCNSDCEQTRCGAFGLGEMAAICRAHRCVFDLSCDPTLVTCSDVEPTCLYEGQVPSVQDGCWGPCVQPNECSAIAGCSACPATTTSTYAYPEIASQVCVTDDSSPLSMLHCVEVTSSCAENPTCECVAACSAQCSDANGIGCF